MSAVVDPNMAAVVLKALAEAGYTITPPAPVAPEPPAEPESRQPSPEAVCHRCGVETARDNARAEGWQRTPEGWVCNGHSPIDFMFAGDLASGLIDQAELTFASLMKLQKGVPEALRAIDEMRYLLADLEGVVRPLRQKPAA